jgi:uncharacterized protein YtpQ (UPF0354 family)
MTTSAGETPAWAHGLGPQGFQTFLALVKQYFADRHIAMHLDIAEGLLRPQVNDAEQSSVFGLQNIAQTCSQADRDQWHDLIHSHFDCIFAASDDQNALRIDVSDFDKVRASIRARLYPTELEQQSVETVHRAGPEGTLEVIVVDLPKSVRTVSRSESAEWGVSREDLFSLGRRNLAMHTHVQMHTVEVQAGIELLAFMGDAYYAASHALLLDQHLQGDLPHGALVGIPRRDVLLVHPIRNIGAADAISSMLQAILHWHAEGPGSLSPLLYWYVAGEFITLTYTINDDALDFTPPVEFLDMLKMLSDRASLS